MLSLRRGFLTYAIFSSQVHNQNEKKLRAIIESVVLQLLEFANIPCLIFTVCGWIVAFPGFTCFYAPKGTLGGI